MHWVSSGARTGCVLGQIKMESPHISAGHNKPPRTITEQTRVHAISGTDTKRPASIVLPSTRRGYIDCFKTGCITWSPRVRVTCASFTALSTLSHGHYTPDHGALGADRKRAILTKKEQQQFVIVLVQVALRKVVGPAQIEFTT